MTFDNKVFHVIYLSIKNGNTIEAGLQIVDLIDTKNLPNGDTYAINLVDLRDFDLVKLSGNVKMIDVNYDNFEHTNIVVNNNIIRSWHANSLPNVIAQKYESLKIKRDGDQKDVLSSKKVFRAIPCDANHDNNLGFFECYDCMDNAIDANAMSKFICDVPVAGWASCWASSSAACVVLSSMY